MEGVVEMVVEIEKKYLIEGLPKGIELVSTKRIEQIYLEVTKTREERVRAIKDVKTGDVKYTRTIKEDIEGAEGVALERKEEEWEISKSEYIELAKRGISHINKVRRKYKQEDGSEITVDALPSGEYLLEKEYTSKEEAEADEINLEGIGAIKEVTKDPRYKNQNIAEKIKR